MKPLTVKELIEKLVVLPLDLPVRIEGCDCIGDACDVKRVPRNTDLYVDDEHVLITRE